MEVSIKEAVRRLGVSASTIRRRIRSGDLRGRKESVALGEGLGRTEQWLVEIPDEGGDSMEERTNGDENEEMTTPETPEVEEDISEGDEEVVNCAVCRKPILDTDYTIEAAYGTVHEEPCSHQTRSAR